MDILKGENTAAAIGAAILKGFSNADELTKSEEQVKLEKSIKDGDIKVVTVEDIEKSFGGKFYTAESIAKLEDVLESQIKKGESEHLTAEEFTTIESSRQDIDSLEEVIVKGEQDGKPFLARVFVQRHIAATEK